MLRRPNFATASLYERGSACERKLPVVVELDEIVAAFGWVLRYRCGRVGNVFHQEWPVSLEEWKHLRRQGFDRLIHHQALRTFAPAKRRHA